MCYGVADVAKACVKSVSGGVPALEARSDCEQSTSGSTRPEPLVHQAHTQPIKQAPQVIQLDGIWVTITTSGETVTYDKRNRARGQRKGKKVVILVALGLQSREWRRKTGNCGLADCFQ